MHMIRHQHISVNFTLMRAASSLKELQIESVVLISKEAWLSIHAALRYVLRDSGYVQSRRAGHLESFCKPPSVWTVQRNSAIDISA